MCVRPHLSGLTRNDYLPPIYPQWACGQAQPRLSLGETHDPA
jgi:hypothetical protein